jgi:hypothetical protein
MSISSEFAIRQMNRLSRLRNFPGDQDSYEDLVAALMTAPNDDAAEEFAMGSIRDCEFAPRPYDVCQRCGPRKAVEYWQPPPKEPKCKICGDTGFEIVERAGLTTTRDCVSRKKLRLVG